MRPSACGICRSLIFFENTSSLTCGSELGYDRDAREKLRFVHVMVTTYR